MPPTRALATSPPASARVRKASGDQSRYVSSSLSAIMRTSRLTLSFVLLQMQGARWFRRLLACSLTVYIPHILHFLFHTDLYSPST